MTIEELRREADKLGYRLSKKPKKIPLSNCTCNTKIREIEDFHISPYGKFYRCSRCNKKSSYTTSERRARMTWNDMIRKESK